MKSGSNLRNVTFIARIRNPIEEEENVITYTNRQSSFDAYNTQGVNKNQIMQSQTFTTPLNTSYISTKDNPQTKSSTLFTLSQPQPSLIITTQKPLGNKFIQTNLTSEDELEANKGFLVKQYKAAFFEFDRIYTESQSLDTIYIDQVKDRVNNMFIGVSDNVLIFGPTNSGKSYLIRGGNENRGKGILDRSVQDMFKLIELNLNSDLKIRVSVLAVVNNFVYDLLSHEKSERNFRNQGSSSSYSRIIILNKGEFDVCLSEAMENLKKVSSSEGRFNIVFSFILENNSRGRTVISQMNFVELVPSEFGLPDFNEDLTSRERDVDNLGNPEILINDNSTIPQNYHTNTDLSTIKHQHSLAYNRMLSNELTALSNFISQGSVSENSALIKILNMDNNCNLLFIACLIPNSVPPVDSQNALKFISWINNNLSSNSNQYSMRNNPTTRKNRNPEINELPTPITSNNNRVQVNNERYKEVYKSEYFNDNNENENVNTFKSPVKAQSHHDLKQEINTLKQLKNKMRRNKNKGQDSKNFSNNFSNSNFANESHFEDTETENDQNYKKLERSVRVNKAKIEEINRNVENLINKQNKPKTREGSLVINEANNSGLMGVGINPNNISELLEYEKMKQENVTLKSDTLIFREDVNYLTELNRNLENELSLQRKKNFETIQENEALHKELAQKQLEVEKLTEAISKLRLFDNPGLEFALESRHNKDIKIRELEIELKTLRKSEQESEIEHRILQEKYSDLKNKFEEVNSELNSLRIKETEYINELESKIEKLSKELEFISKENKSMRLTDEKCRFEINTLTKLKEKYESKYKIKKEEVSELTKKLSEVEGELKMILREREAENYDINREKLEMKSKIEKKQKILEEMQNKISEYKKDAERKRMFKK